MEHTYKQFDTELESVRAQVLEMGGIVEDMVDKAIESLVSGNVALAAQVMATDERVNALEMKCDEACTQIIARRQPAAGDLRMILTIIRIINDLERIGDKAAKISRFASQMHDSARVNIPRYTELKYMAGVALKMLREALDAFARVDASAAASVARQDKEVDEEFHLLTRHLITYMMEDPRTISTFIDLMFVAKAIERIGDHAKNISEYVVFMVKGVNVRHASLEVLEREVG